jgi:hypothetical protein
MSYALQGSRRKVVVMASQAHAAAVCLLLIGTVALTAACDSSASVGTAAKAQVRTAGHDCPAELHYHGVNYTAYRLTRVQPTRLGQAQPVCGETGQGTGAGRVTVWRFPGQSASKVIGRASSDGRFAVYVADSVLPVERTRVLAAVRSDGR